MPRWPTLDVPWPFRGLSTGHAFSAQPGLTSAEMENTRSDDPATGRTRGGAREGFQHFLTSPAAVGSPVRRMELSVANDRRITYAFQAQPPSDWTRTFKTSGALSTVVRTDRRGDVYFTDGSAAWVKLNPYGEELWRQPLELGFATQIITGLWIDRDLSVYVSVGHATDPLNASAQNTARLWKYVVNETGDGYELAWLLEPAKFITDLFVYKDVLYTMQADYSTLPVKTTDLVWYRDVNLFTAPIDQTSITIPNASIWTSTNKGLIGHSFAVRDKGGLEFIVCGTDGGPFSPDTEENFFLAKVSALGAVVWKFTNGLGTTSGVPTVYLNGTGGIGFGVAVDSQSNIYSIGHGSGAAGEGVWLRRIVDQGSTASTIAAGTWKITSAFDVLWEFPRFAVDKWDSVYAPYNVGVLGSSTPRAVRIFNVAGTEFLSSIILGTYSGVARDVAVSTAIPPGTLPDTPDLQPDDVKSPEFVYVAGQQTTSTDPIWHKRTLLLVASEAGSPRDHKLIAVSPPDVKLFSAAGVVAPTGGAGIIDATAQYVSSTVLFGKVFISDGLRDFVVDPRSTVADPNGRVDPWQSKTSGVMPARAKLLFTWRARVGRGRTPDDPHNFYLSATEDAFDWDFQPPIRSSTQAIAANASSAGLVPDLPNCFIPYDDDLLLIGCDSSIWRATGSPLKGGEIDRISRIAGMSFGRPFCVDPAGIVYFHGNAGGIWTLSSAGGVARISSDAIDQELLELDLSQVYVELHWDNVARGIHIAVFPFGDLGTLRRHWFFEQSTGAFTPQTYANAAVQPTAILSFDGDDPGDRTLLFAGEDGYVGKVSRAAADDRGYPTPSTVLIGPLIRREQRDDATRATSLEVTLASDQSGCGFELFATDVADAIGDPVQAGFLSPGFNRIRILAKGRYLYLRLFSGILGRRWAFESAALKAAPAGRVHV